jgi:hypothetical protein
MFKLRDKNYKKLKTPEEQKAAIRKFRDDWLEDNERDRVAMAKGRGAAPKDKVSEQTWNAEWARLKPGESKVGLDGKVYIKQ